MQPRSTSSGSGPVAPPTGEIATVGGLASIVITTCSLMFSPVVGSSTVTVAVYGLPESSTYWCEGFSVLSAGEPSPKSQLTV